jgi:prepilin-type N-terminal cleavage/methylation domain-containing protein
MQNRQRGFTLTELMVVVAIIAVLVTLAVVYMSPKVRPIDVANRVGELVREGNRRAVALGPVRADVAVALGTKARTQILAVQAGSTVTFTLYRLEEGPLGSPTGTWMPITSYVTHQNVAVDTWAVGIGSHATLTLVANWNLFSTQCRPDGTCDARTMFFQAASQQPDYETYGKLSIMPLGGAISTAADWN